jgi:hypothetical protein
MLSRCVRLLLSVNNANGSKSCTTPSLHSSIPPAPTALLYLLLHLALLQSAPAVTRESAGHVQYIGQLLPLHCTAPPYCPHYPLDSTLQLQPVPAAAVLSQLSPAALWAAAPAASCLCMCTRPRPTACYVTLRYSCGDSACHTVLQIGFSAPAEPLRSPSPIAQLACCIVFP